MGSNPLSAKLRPLFCSSSPLPSCSRQLFRPAARLGRGGPGAGGAAADSPSIPIPCQLPVCIPGLPTDHSPCCLCCGPSSSLCLGRRCCGPYACALLRPSTGACAGPCASTHYANHPGGPASLCGDSWGNQPLCPGAAGELAGAAPVPGLLLPRAHRQQACGVPGALLLHMPSRLIAPCCCPPQTPTSTQVQRGSVTPGASTAQSASTGQRECSAWCEIA